MLVDHALERTLVMAIVVAPELARELPEAFDGDVLGDLQARAAWLAICRLVERGERVDLESVRAELEAWAEHRELTWYERPSPAWPRALCDVAEDLAERLAVDPGSLPIAAWSESLMRIAANRTATLALDEDLEIEAPEAPEVRTAA